MTELLFRLLSLTALIIFSLGILSMLLRKEGIWLAVGQVLAFKAAIFGTGVVLSSFPERTKVMSTIMFCGLFFYILYFLIGVAILIRVRRFGGNANLSKLSFLRH